MKQINVEKVIELAKKRINLDGLDVENVEFFFKDKKVEIDEKELKEWAFTGLGFVDFIMSRDWE